MSPYKQKVMSNEMVVATGIVVGMIIAVIYNKYISISHEKFDDVNKKNKRECNNKGGTWYREWLGSSLVFSGNSKCVPWKAPNNKLHGYCCYFKSDTAPNTGSNAKPVV